MIRTRQGSLRRKDGGQAMSRYMQTGTAHHDRLLLLGNTLPKLACWLESNVLRECEAVPPILDSPRGPCSQTHGCDERRNHEWVQERYSDGTESGRHVGVARRPGAPKVRLDERLELEEAGRRRWSRGLEREGCGKGRDLPGQTRKAIGECKTGL